MICKGCVTNKHEPETQKSSKYEIVFYMDEWILENINLYFPSILEAPKNQVQYECTCLQQKYLPTIDPWCAISKQPLIMEMLYHLKSPGKWLEVC